MCRSIGCGFPQGFRQPGSLAGTTTKAGRVIQVIDVFAGPGGLNEGFSSVEDASGNSVFRVAASFEMESNAVNTLILRAAMRRLRTDGRFHPDYYRFLNSEITEGQFRALPHIAQAMEIAATEVHQIELGPTERENVTSIIRGATSTDEPVVLIGGPPCQAYSLVGRARRKHDEKFLEDKKHFLFREYLDILQTVRPDVFVMENVKGLLSSRHGDDRMFQLIMSDLTANGDYEVRSLVVPVEQPRPGDFIIRAERFGVPQARHRVILLGIRKDAGRISDTLAPSLEHPTLGDVLSGLPAVRSRLSPLSADDAETWNWARQKGRVYAGREQDRRKPPPVARTHQPLLPNTMPQRIRDWLIDPALEKITLHEPRAHMETDLIRYEYLALMKEKHIVPRVNELPPALAPQHRNVASEGTPFTDRFKVQGRAGASSTIVSHMAKDGHHFIHPDPHQMRSLTVREAARLQTFPDNYFFTGSRTAQYQQVGNAVPPYLARQIANVVARILDRV